MKAVIVSAALFIASHSMANEPISADVTRMLAEQGHSKAQYMLGQYYSEGYGVTQNLSEAFAWYRRSAEQGYRDAQFALATAYDTGEGVAQNLALAANWYKEAALQGDGAAAYNLGIMYDEGAGVAADKQQALSWLKLAILLKHEMAEEALQQTSALLAPALLQQADQNAQDLLQQIRQP